MVSLTVKMHKISVVFFCVISISSAHYIC
jgi:hypothetical protein